MGLGIDTYRRLMRHMIAVYPHPAEVTPEAQLEIGAGPGERHHLIDNAVCLMLERIVGVADCELRRERLANNASERSRKQEHSAPHLRGDAGKSGEKTNNYYGEKSRWWGR